MVYQQHSLISDLQQDATIKYYEPKFLHNLSKPMVSYKMMRYSYREFSRCSTGCSYIMIYGTKTVYGYS
jgi:hypothetical protein